MRKLFGFKFGRNKLFILQMGYSYWKLDFIIALVPEWEVLWIYYFYFVSDYWDFFGFFPDFLVISRLQNIFFHIILLNSSYWSGFDHISSQNGWFAPHKWYDKFLFQKLIRIPDFLDFCRISFKSSDFTFNFFFKVDKLITNVMFFPIFF